MKINENIKNFRVFRGITQSELAAHLNKSKGAISNWERGDNMPNLDEVERLCQIFNVTPNQIFGWEPVPEYDEYVEKQRVRMAKIKELKDQQEKLQKDLAALNLEIAEERKKLLEEMEED